jgi:hypothetical protein
MRVWVDLTSSVERRSGHGGLRIRRDPRELVKLLLSAAS